MRRLNLDQLKASDIPEMFAIVTDLQVHLIGIYSKITNYYEFGHFIS